ncbi:MAG TPA: aminomethyl-transferring glycine dehydrogenase [Acidimicrobiales bacterium]|nr:aminomethyl-transferring glycine dehydrogenase [Acidimicrobiales bacterium]
MGPSPAEQSKMLAALGFGSLDELAAAAVPPAIRSARPLELPAPLGEREALERLRDLATRNTVRRSMIGLGYHDTVTPEVIRRDVLEGPGWFSAYTPYQPEISQGRLEALLNFQTTVADLSGLPVSNASLLDEASAAAEAMLLIRRATRGASRRFLVDADALPQTIAVLETRAAPLGIELEVVEPSAPLPAGEFFGLLLQYPGASGALRDLAPVVAAAHERGALVAVAADLLALTLCRPPGELGADVALGSAQRFGVPMGYGGPHAAYLAVRTGLERQLPGRLVGVSVDAAGRPALRLALQAREQHIRRERATSNICTAQVLLAVVAGMYAVYHGPEGLEAIAARVHGLARRLAEGLRAGGIRVVHEAFFDTVLAAVPGRAREVVARARERGILLRLVDDDHVAVACDETTSEADLKAVWEAFGVPPAPATDGEGVDAIPATLRRTSAFLTHPVFHAYRSETELLRYLRRLADRDYALDRGMIPLGSCTMKLNAAAELAPVSWREFADLHPLCPPEDAAGYRLLGAQLEAALAEITGYDAVSLQPNAGSQGELAGLLAIRAYLRSRGEERRDVCLVPESAHGTNAASAVLAGMRVVAVACSANGDVDVDDLEGKVAAHAGELAAVMLTYPSTHGVFEEGVSRICELVHEAGGQVYIDGANLNALIGLVRPGEIGGDVSHLNLHKTFCIPHGGGGPGVGPVAARRHLAPFLPTHPAHPDPGRREGVGPVAAAPYGSAGILPIAWTYLAMMGADGLAEATKVALLAANYVARRLAPYFPVLYTGRGGLVAHECILDLRPATRASGVTAEDVAKRLIDYGFHAPTLSFPVAGTLMVEPTESESLAELDRFCEAMIAIRAEIDRVAAGEWPREDNPLRNAPHPVEALAASDWTHPYSREEAVFPLPSLRTRSYFPPTRRIDAAYGDRHLVCACPPVADLAG